MNLKEKLKEITEQFITNQAHFLVDVVIGGNAGLAKITIILDGDEGISIDDCAIISRKVGNLIEEQSLLDSAYILEVSSPGLDQPLALKRQYKKNIGRRLEITLKEDKIFKGKLEEVDDNRIVLNSEVKKGKKLSFELVEIPFNDIKKTNILVSFN
ncbi:MAG: ribosome maturation factor RimP [Cytophagaceae bacterium]